MNKYLGLLRWSLNYHDGTRDNVKPMSEERRKWLLEAIESQIVDPVEQMKHVLEILKLPRPTVDDESYFMKQTEAIEQVLEYVDNFDFAKDFEKLGGIEVIINLVQLAKHEKTRMLSFELLSTISQNHPYIQDVIFKKNGMELLISFLSSVEVSVAVKAKALGALGSIIRGNEILSNRFLVEFKGLVTLFSIIQSSITQASCEQSQRLIRKSLFLILYFVETQENVRSPLKSNYVKDLQEYHLKLSDIDSKDIVGSILKILENSSFDKEKAPEKNSTLLLK